MAVKAEQEKRLEYASLMWTHHFVPVAIETLGAFGPSAYDLFSEVGSRVHTVTQEVRSRAHLVQQVSAAIQRGNAACVMGTFPV